MARRKYLKLEGSPGSGIPHLADVLFDLMTDQGFTPAADIGVGPERGIICVPNLADSVAFVQVK